MFATFVNGVKQGQGNKETMIKLAKALGRSPKSGTVAVYKLTPMGNMLGQPIWKSVDGKTK